MISVLPPILYGLSPIIFVLYNVRHSSGRGKGEPYGYRPACPTSLTHTPGITSVRMMTDSMCRSVGYVFLPPSALLRESGIPPMGNFFCLSEALCLYPDSEHFSPCFLLPRYVIRFFELQRYSSVRHCPSSCGVLQEISILYR